MKAPLSTITKLGFAGLALILTASAYAEGWERDRYRGDGSPPPPARFGNEPRRFNPPEPIVQPLPGPIVGPSLLDRGDGRANRDRYDRYDQYDRGYIRDRRFRRDPYYGRPYRNDRDFGVPPAPIENQYPNSWMSNDGPPPVGY